MKDIGESQLCHLSESFVASIQLLDQAHPVNDSNTWGWDLFCCWNILLQFCGKGRLVCYISRES